MRNIIVVISSFFITISVCFADDLPRFYGIYVLQNGQYVEVKRVTIFKRVQYNKHKRNDRDVDFNESVSILDDFFKKTKREVFNKEGFLVIQDGKWSDFELFRVPHTGKFTKNEQSRHIVTGVFRKGTPIGLTSISGLDPAVEPTKIQIKKIKIGENANIYVPETPVDSGCYVIDYTKNGKAFLGWNPIRVE